MSSVASLKKTGQTASDDQTTQAGIRGMSPIIFQVVILKFFFAVIEMT